MTAEAVAHAPLDAGSATGPAARRQAFAVLTAAGVAALAISTYLAFAGTQEVTAGPSTYSRSAIGHDGLLALLQAEGIDASASRGASVEKTRHGGLLVLAEPEFGATSKAMLLRLLVARNVLLVLPKWGGPADQDRRGWLALATALPESLPQSVLDDADLEASLIRPDHAAPITVNWLGVGVHLANPSQLISAPGLEPLVAGLDGVLVAHRAVRGRELTVLADPDAIANHGLADGNAAFALALINRARHGGPVVFDETIHGFTAAPSGRLRLLFARPFLAATLNAVLACVMLAWAGAVPFGARLAPPARFRPGKLALIDNITALLLGAGQATDLLRRYVAATIEDVAGRLHAPENARGDWLARVQAQRGMRRDAAAIEAEARAVPRDQAAQFAVAEAIYHWKQEMLHGSAGIKPDSGRDSRGNPQGGGGAG